MSIELNKTGLNPNPPVASKRFAGMQAVLATDNRGRTRACWEDGDGNLYPGPVVTWSDDDMARKAAKQDARNAKTVEARDEMLALREVKQRRDADQPLRPADIEVLADAMLKRMGI